MSRPKGYIVSEETKAKISAAKKANAAKKKAGKETGGNIADSKK